MTILKDLKSIGLTMETTQIAADRARWKSPAAASSTFRRKEDWVRDSLFNPWLSFVKSFLFSNWIESDWVSYQIINVKCKNRKKRKKSLKIHIKLKDAVSKRDIQRPPNKLIKHKYYKFGSFTLLVILEGILQNYCN